MEIIFLTRRVYYAHYKLQSWTKYLRDSSFHVKLGTKGKAQFPIFRSFLLVLKKFSFWEEDSALGHNFMKFRDFRQLVKLLAYTMFITNNHALFQLWWRKIGLNIKKTQNIMIIIVGSNLWNGTHFCPGLLIMKENSLKEANVLLECNCGGNSISLMKWRIYQISPSNKGLE